jgi:formyltetrahydrofolate synthetase
MIGQFCFEFCKLKRVSVMDWVALRNVFSSKEAKKQFFRLETFHFLISTCKYLAILCFAKRHSGLGSTVKTREIIQQDETEKFIELEKRAMKCMELEKEESMIRRKLEADLLRITENPQVCNEALLLELQI